MNHLPSVHIFTGSAETEAMLGVFCAFADNLDDWAPLAAFTDEAMLDVMVRGRNGPSDRYPGSTASDDTGGFFRLDGDRVFLTDKGKACIRPLALAE